MVSESVRMAREEVDRLFRLELKVAEYLRRSRVPDGVYCVKFNGTTYMVHVRRYEGVYSVRPLSGDVFGAIDTLAQLTEEHGKLLAEKRELEDLLERLHHYNITRYDEDLAKELAEIEQKLASIESEIKCSWDQG